MAAKRRHARAALRVAKRKNEAAASRAAISSRSHGDLTAASRAAIGCALSRASTTRHRWGRWQPRGALDLGAKHAPC